MSRLKLPYTPETISKDSGLLFSIPLYQRLFEWGDDQITQLLDDLYASYTRNQNSPYYIGMLTSHNSRCIDLVDGQQRFTALMLLGIHFGWKDFVKVTANGREYTRLRFYARDDDEKYLMCKINGVEPEYKNEKMEKGLGCIESHLTKLFGNDKDKEERFGNYIYRHITFFLSELPNDYSANELNTYFERMNTSGKSLENYEILKVEVLKRLNANKESYTLLWNATSIMEKTILRKHYNEDLDTLRKRYLRGMLDIIDGKGIGNCYEKINARFDEAEDDYDVENENVVQEEPKSIGEIDINKENPYKIVKRRTEEHSLLTFPEFLLQVLYLNLGQDIDDKIIDGVEVEGVNTTDFFDVRKLGETFKWAFDKRGLDARKFMDDLALYRLLTDYFIIRMDDEDEDPYPFELYKADEKVFKAQVKMYLSMLYSASSPMTYYLWMPDLLLYLRNQIDENRTLELDGYEYLKKLKEIDNRWHPESDLKEENLTFKTIDRYWFWRIDYYLWEKRDEFFTRADAQSVADNYIFRRNRSIEHIAPQTLEEEYGDKERFKWGNENESDTERYRDCLGNMVMISSGQNSTLSNSCFEVKHALMDRYCKSINNGHIESLKMLYVYTKYDDWSIPNIDDHNKFSLNFLRESYNYV